MIESTHEFDIEPSQLRLLVVGRFDCHCSQIHVQLLLSLILARFDLCAGNVSLTCASTCECLTLACVIPYDTSHWHLFVCYLHLSSTVHCTCSLKLVSIIILHALEKYNSKYSFND